MPEAMPGAARVLVTRPAREAMPWVQGLQTHGMAAQALPLIDIRALRDPVLLQALEQARRALGQYRAAMFVSPNAVAHFLADTAEDSESNPAQTLTRQALTAIDTRAWAPGPGTLRALQAAGVPAARIDAPPATSAQFDSEALWPCVATQVRPGDRILIVRGSGGPAVEGGQGRPWLGAQLAAAGAEVHFVAAYERCAPQWTAAQQALARAAAHDGTLWLLSSSEALMHLQTLLPGQDWQHARALATHARIAQTAREAGFGAVHECRPALADVAASIKSLHAHRDSS